MNLFETLKQFKNISSDPAYREKSKRAILATLPREPWSMWRLVTRITETGIAVALAVFFILIIAGRFPSIPYVAPVQFSVIDPQTLRAEAQAVDIQIQLANVAYQQPVTAAATTTSETTPQTAPGAHPGFAAAALQATSSPAGTAASSTLPSGTAPAGSSSTQATVSVDDALKPLAQ